MRQLFLVFVCMLAWGWAQPLPAPPPALPPLVEANVQTPPAQAQQVEYKLQAGWNPIALPFVAVEGTRGFRYGIVNAQGHLVDLKQPGQLAGQGFWTYADEDGSATVWGKPVGDAWVVDLKPGWNFVGSPYQVPVPLSQVTFGDGQRVNQLWEEVEQSFPQRWTLGTLKSFNAPADELQPGVGYWMRTGQPLSMRWNSPAEVPVVSAIRKLQPNQYLLEGQNFGPRAAGRLILNTHTVLDSDIKEWSDTRVAFSFPGNTSPETVTVVAGGAATARVAVRGNLMVKDADGIPATEEAAPAPETNGPLTTATFKILNELQDPIPNANVRLEGYRLGGTTNSSGVVRFVDVPQGFYRVYLTAPNYPRSNARVSIGPKGYKGTHIMNCPTAPITLYASPYQGYRPSLIEVYCKKDPRRTNWAYFRTDYRQDQVCFYWPSVPANTIYCIQLTWRNRQGYEKKIYLERMVQVGGLREYYNDFSAY